MTLEDDKMANVLVLQVNRDGNDLLRHVAVVEDGVRQGGDAQQRERRGYEEERPQVGPLSRRRGHIVIRLFDELLYVKL